MRLFLQQWLDDLIKSQDYPGFLSFVPKVLLAVAIPALDSAYQNVAVWLNDKGMVPRQKKPNKLK